MPVIALYLQTSISGFLGFQWACKLAVCPFHCVDHRLIRPSEPPVAYLSQFSVTLLTAGFCFYVSDSNRAKVPLTAFFGFLFVAFYLYGEVPVPFTHSAKIFPLIHREMGIKWESDRGALLHAFLSIRPFIDLLPSLERCWECLGVLFLCRTERGCFHYDYLPSARNRAKDIGSDRPCLRRFGCHTSHPIFSDPGFNSFSIFQIFWDFSKTIFFGPN